MSQIYKSAVGGSGGIGDVVGPASSTDNALVRFDGTTGKLIKNGVALETDTGEMLAGNGSTANPGWSFVSDPGTGFHTDGGGNTNFSTGAVDTILLTSTFSRFLQPLQFYNQAVFWDGVQMPNVVFQVSGTYAASIHDLVLLANTSNAITFQLPDAPSQGQTYYIKDANGLGAAVNNITVTTPGGTTTIDGVTSYVINVTRGAIQVTYNTTVGGYLIL